MFARADERVHAADCMAVVVAVFEEDTVGDH